MEAEARTILQTALGAQPDELTVGELFERIHARFAALGGVELELPSRKGTREPPKFD
jgi:plasmid stability protein